MPPRPNPISASASGNRLSACAPTPSVSRRSSPPTGENRGPKGTVRQSNVTDPESAKMKTAHGVIQGYTAVAAVDGKHQVIVHGEAHADGQEHGLLIPTVEGVRKNLDALGDNDVLTKATLSADAGYASEANMQYVFEAG